MRLGLGTDVFGFLRQATIFDVIWDMSSSSTVLTGTNGVHPIHSKMKGCVLSDAGVVQYYLDDSNHFNKAGMAPSISGTAASGTGKLTLVDTGAFVGAEVGAYVYNSSKGRYFQIVTRTDDQLTFQFALDSVVDKWGVADGTSSGKLVDSAGDFVNKGVQVGMIAHKRDQSASAVITNVTATELTLDADIFVSTDEYSISDGWEVGDSYEVQTAVLDGSDGQVMIEIPKFYFKYVGDTNTRTWYLSDLPATGYEVHPAFVVGGVEKSYIYVGKYEGSIEDANSRGQQSNALTGYNLGTDKLASVAGFQPVTSGQRSEFRTVAANRGAGWQQIDWLTNWALQLLYMAEYSDMHSQSVLSYGVSNWSSSVWNNYISYYAIGHTAFGTHKGTTSFDGVLSGGDVGSYMAYRGIENWYGNIWKWLDGINFNSGAVYISDDPSVYADDTTTDYTDVGITNATSNGYISKVGDSKWGLLPTESSGSSSTYIPDYYFYNSGWRVALGGGSAFNGVNAGFATLYASDASSFRFATVGSRLCFR